MALQLKAGFLLLTVAAAGALSFLLDGRVVRIFASVQHPGITYLMTWLSNLSSLIIIVILTSLFLFEEKKKKWIKVLWISALAAQAITWLLKLLISRPRPGIFDGRMLLDYSFPSGHAAVAFTLVPVLSREFPELKWFWILFAALVALSRLYLGVHYLSDAIFGAVLGYAIGQGFVWMQEKGKLTLKWKEKSSSR